ncbi:DUF6778 family protein [Thalassococcus sp. BH17M4-6]|uniref:DUF6778 family protein n=1 Tax=Thalassococcus sp. BH17M4-6 TaxID=3413148 RepID=UPI003BBCAE6F
MKKSKLFCGLLMGLSLSACATVDTASRNAPPEPMHVAQIAPSVRIAEYSVQVPRSLRVSEANRYYPGGDIVWRGDPAGDRYEQVKAIFETSLARSAQAVQGERPVRVDIVVKRFHAMTEKARYTVGGIHAITFDMTVRDPETGAVLVPQRTVRADLEGLGGSRALAAEARGVTQKYRITNHLVGVIEQELTDPQGYQATEMGLMQAINRIR